MSHSSDLTDDQWEPLEPVISTPGSVAHAQCQMSAPGTRRYDATLSAAIVLEVRMVTMVSVPVGPLPVRSYAAAAVAGVGSVAERRKMPPCRR